MHKAGLNCTTKGLQDQHQGLNKAKAFSGPTHITEAIRNLNRRLARLHEAYRQAAAADQAGPGDDHSGRELDRSLLQKVWGCDTSRTLANPEESQARNT